jgi:8-oxo-dGTP pyrophosphatase MutT (NUDIX family)
MADNFTNCLPPIVHRMSETGRIRDRKLAGRPRLREQGKRRIALINMNAPPSEDPYAPETFFARAAARLLSSPPAKGADRAGDHCLNPTYVPPPGLHFVDAAVLVPVVARRPQASVILTQRTTALKTHAGQIAFPGGKISDEDSGPAAAAIRETEEEIGLSPNLIAPVGYLDAYLTGTGYRVVPVVARVEPDHPLAPSPDEVDAVFEVPLSFLMSPENHRVGSREFRGVLRYFYEMPFEDRYIWGVTAGIIRGLYERVYG